MKKTILFLAIVASSSLFAGQGYYGNSYYNQQQPQPTSGGYQSNGAGTYYGTGSNSGNGYQSNSVGGVNGTGGNSGGGWQSNGAGGLYGTGSNAGRTISPNYIGGNNEN